MLAAKLHKDWQLVEDVDLPGYTDVLEGQSGWDITTVIKTAAQLAFDDWAEGALVIGD